MPAAAAPPGLSLIDLVVGAGSLAARVGLIPVRVAVRVARGPGPDRPADGGDRPDSEESAADRAAPVRPLSDWSAWAVRTVAQVGTVERGRAHIAARSFLDAATSAIAANPDVGRLVREIAGTQLEPLIDQALPIVLDRLADDPVAVRRIVQDQSSGIMSEAADSARHTARHGDEAVDTLVNRLLHRSPHSEAPAEGEPVP